MGLKPRFYEHYSNVKEADWPWLEYFTPDELACYHTGAIHVDPYSLDCLFRMRKAVGLHLNILIGYVDAAFEKELELGPDSQHLLGKAFLIDIHYGPDNRRTHKHARLAEAAAGAGFNGIEIYDNCIRVDNRYKKTLEDYRSK